MSDSSQGPGWWRASDGLWYPPDAAPGPRGRTRSEPDEPGRRPPGVPVPPAADPKVQQPFTPRRVEPLELDREPPRRARRLEEDAPRRVPWGWIGVVLLVLAFGGVGVWLALTAERGEGPTAAPSTTVDTTGTTAPGSSTSTTEATTTTTAGVSVFDLAVGDCFGATPDEDDDGGEVVLTAVEVVECDDPHLAEVVAVTRFRDGPEEPFPGPAARDADAQTLCQPEFEEYVGVPLSGSELGLVWLAPTEETWEEGDREVTCAAQSIDGDPLVGSVAGSQR